MREFLGLCVKRRIYAWVAEFMRIWRRLCVSLEVYEFLGGFMRD